MMKFQPGLIFLFTTVLILSACNSGGLSPADNESLTVSAAISLKDAFTEIGESFKAKTGKKVSYNFGASGTLQNQIETGAPVDVFASAGEKQMNGLAAKGLIDVSSRKNFARNTLVLIVPQNSNLNLMSFRDLADAKVQKIAVGNPKTVPVGEYSEQVFVKNNLKETVEEKLILAENVRQVLDYVMRGETDAGIVYATDASIAKDKVKIAATALEYDYEPILYPIAVLKSAESKQAAREFLNFVLSADGRKILEKYGFSAVK